MPLLTIESERLRVGVLPHYGARVVNLVDKATGRDWIFQGGSSANVGEDAVYSADEAVGWDECFPTVSPCDATSSVWGRRLRDHGDVWGRPWSVEAHEVGVLTTAYATDEFVFRRSLSVSGATLTVDYRVENRTPRPMPYLWALHGLLAVRPGETISLPGVQEVVATYVSNKGVMSETSTLKWPATPQLGFSLAEVQPESSGFAGKFFVAGPADSTAVGSGREQLTIRWGDPIKALGIWANYHGWPAPPHGLHLALEPTTAPANDLAASLAEGNAPSVPPGATHEWTVSFSMTGNAP